MEIEQKLYKKFEQLGIVVKTFRHEAVFSVDESEHLKDEIAGAHCKSLFLKDKKDHYLLVVLLGGRRLDMKALFKSDHLKSHDIQIGRLSFASPERMWDILGVKSGSVTPFALMNAKGYMSEKSIKLNVILDKEMMEYNILNYHPLHNEATTSISRAGLLEFVNHLGFKVVILDFDRL